MDKYLVPFWFHNEDLVHWHRGVLPCPPSRARSIPSSISAVLSCGQSPMGLLTGFSIILCQLVCYRWHQSWVDVQWNDLLKLFQMIHVNFWRYRASALRNPLLRWLRLGTELCARYWCWCCWGIPWYTGSAQSDKSFKPSHQGTQCWPATLGAVTLLLRDLRTAPEVQVVVGSLDPWSTPRVEVKIMWKFGVEIGGLHTVASILCSIYSQSCF
jgi:hypothetical protein